MLLKEKNKIFGWLIFFILLNSLKISIFNQIMMSSFIISNFVFKFFITLIFSTLIFSILFLLRSKILTSLFYIIEFIYIIVILAYYDYYRSFLHFYQAIALFNEGVGIANNNAIPLNGVMFFVALFDLPIIVIIMIKYNDINNYIQSLKRGTKSLVVLIPLVFLILFEIFSYNNQYSLYHLSNTNSRIGESEIVFKYGTFVNSVVDALKNGDANDLVKKIEYGKEISGKSKLNDKSNPNIVIIQVESMDSKAVQVEHNGKKVMNYLSDLAKNNIYYPFTQSYHSAGGTSDCEFSVINSIEPLMNYPSIKLNNYDYNNSFIKVLKNNGYNSYAFHGNIGGYFNRDVAFRKIGFDDFFDINRMNYKNEGWGVSDEKVFDYSKKILDEKSTDLKPWISYIITMTSHEPFTNVNEYYQNNSFNDIDDDLTKAYMKSMAYVDETIQKYIEDIKGKFPNTYFIIFGDHSPKVNTKYYNQVTLSDGDIYLEYVPLIIVTPDNKKYQEETEIASFLDIAPTVLNFANINFTYFSNGRDLINLNGGSDIPYKGKKQNRKVQYNKIMSNK